MKIKPIRTDKDYLNALEKLEVIFDADSNSEKGDEAEILSPKITKTDIIQLKFEIIEAIKIEWKK